MLQHGGRLNNAVKRWGIPREQWLDLSTGINPTGWRVAELPADVWQRLPEEDDGLEQVIRNWSGAPRAAGCVPVAGSQTAIMALPTLRKPCRVGIPVPGYREHGHSWQNAGHQVVPVAPAQTNGGASGFDDRWLDQLDVLVWINPNNPTGHTIPPATLLRWHHRLQKRGAWLVVDEAFMDTTPGFSLCSQTGLPGLVVLRSLGKFFGLAGVRAGFVLADQTVADSLRERLGPWAVSGPARYVMQQALLDTHWQAITRRRLSRDSQRLANLLGAAGLQVTGGTPLFQTVYASKPWHLADTLAAEGILLRVFEQSARLRFGLPPENQWGRLQQVLLSCTNSKYPSFGVDQTLTHC